MVDAEQQLTVAAGPTVLGFVFSPVETLLIELRQQIQEELKEQLAAVLPAGWLFSLNGIAVSTVQEKKFSASRLLGERTRLDLVADSFAKDVAVQAQKENVAANQRETDEVKPRAHKPGISFPMMSTVTVHKLQNQTSLKYNYQPAVVDGFEHTTGRYCIQITAGEHKGQRLMVRPECLLSRRSTTEQQADKEVVVVEKAIDQEKTAEAAEAAEAAAATKAKAAEAAAEAAAQAAAAKKAAAAEVAAEAKAAKQAKRAAREAAAAAVKAAREETARAKAAEKAAEKAAKVAEPKPPKKPSNQYACFVSSTQRALKQEQPSLSQPEVMKALGERWKAMGDAERAAFALAAEADDARYRAEYADYLRACMVADIPPVAEAPLPKTTAQQPKLPPAPMAASATEPVVVELDSPIPHEQPAHAPRESVRAPHSTAPLIGRHLHITHLHSMAELVGRRVSVYWDGDGQYFDGTVREFSTGDERHLVVYDDGDQDWYYLVDEMIRWPAGTPDCLRVAPARDQYIDLPSGDPRCCPLTLELFKDPVKTTYGQTYERTAIEGWFRTKATDPMTGKSVPQTTLYPDDDMRKRCNELRAERSKTRAERARAVHQRLAARKTKESAGAMFEAAHAQQALMISLAAQVTKHAKRKTVRASDIDLVASILARNGK